MGIIILYFLFYPFFFQINSLRFCGSFDQVKWIAGWFSSNEDVTYDIHTNFIVHWKATETFIQNPPTDTTFTLAVNNLSADKDTGKFGSSIYGAPDIDTDPNSWGALF